MWLILSSINVSSKILALPTAPLCSMRQQTIKKRVGGLASITWFLKVGATGLKPAT